SQSAALLTSWRMKTAEAPICAASRSPISIDRPEVSTTLAPSAAMCRACSAPSPLLPPVTMATLPHKRPTAVSPRAPLISELNILLQTGAAYPTLPTASGKTAGPKRADNMKTCFVDQYPGRVAATDPQRVALVCGDRRVTYGELESRMQRVAA